MRVTMHGCIVRVTEAAHAKRRCNKHKAHPDTSQNSQEAGKHTSFTQESFCTPRLCLECKNAHPLPSNASRGISR